MLIEIVYEVVLRTNDIETNNRPSSNNHHNNHNNHHSNALKHPTDVYFIIKGIKGSTKKIYLNNYEIRKPEHDANRERFFEFKSDDVGKIEKINVSINEDDNPSNYVFIDFIEIKIPSRSEAYK